MPTGAGGRPAPLRSGWRRPGTTTQLLAADVAADVVHDLTGLLVASAVFATPDRRHRYLLTRQWDPHRPPLVFVLLNPSTAGAHHSDPTVRRCVERAHRLGYGGCWVLNTYALVATDPAGLRRDPDPVGRHNDTYLHEFTHALPRGARVVAGWGSGGPDPDRVRRVHELLADVPLWCLGSNGDGRPRHPGRLPYDQPLVRYHPGGTVHAVPTVLQGERCDRYGRWAGLVVTSYDGDAVSVYDLAHPARRWCPYRPA